MNRYIGLLFLILGVIFICGGAYCVVVSILGDESLVFAGILAIAVGMANILASKFLERLTK